MDAKKSPFILKNFFLLNQNIEVVPLLEKKQIDVPKLFDTYSIDIDFVINDIDENSISLFMKVLINTDNSGKPGYIIISEGVCIFEFDKSEALNKSQKDGFIYFSGISICLNSLRAIITNVTAFCPFGRYSLPTIDVNELLNSKNDSKKTIK